MNKNMKFYIFIGANNPILKQTNIHSTVVVSVKRVVVVQIQMIEGDPVVVLLALTLKIIMAKLALKHLLFMYNVLYPLERAELFQLTKI